MKYDVFISYSRKDTAIADQICAAFDKVGISYFIDRQGIGGGMEFPKVLAPAIRESEVFLLLASQNAYDSAFTDREITFAFNKKRGEKMLPYIIDDVVFPEHLELIFSSNNWLIMKSHPIETRLVDDVLRLLGRTRPKTENTPQPKQVKATNFSTETDDEPELTIKYQNGKFGFVDEKGKIVIPFEYNYAQAFSEGLAAVGIGDWRNREYGFIDKYGKTVIPCIYDNAQSFFEGTALVEKNGKYGGINKQGKIIIPFEYDSSRSFSDGLACVEKNKKWGFIDKHGKTIIPFIYDHADSFYEGFAGVQKNGKWGFIDKQGHTVIPFEFGKPYFGGFANGLCCIYKNDDNHIGFIDKKGNTIIPFIYAEIECGDWDGCSYMDPFYNSEGLLGVFKGTIKYIRRDKSIQTGKWGYIDNRGKEIIPFQYSYAGPFLNGIAKVEKRILGIKQTFYIDKQGNRID